MINKITIVTSEAFPNGMAGTNRIISMAKGFISHGVQTCVISFYKYGESGSVSVNPREGVFEGIQFRNVFQSQFKNPSRLVRLLHELAKPLLIFYSAIKNVSGGTVVLYYADKTWPAAALRIVTIVRNALLIKEETEHPAVRVEKKIRFSRYLYLKFHYRVFDGLMVITQNLNEYFTDSMHYSKPIFLVPMIVDIERFNDIDKAESQSIVFSGELNDKKEGVTTLIKAFHLISGKYPHLMLDLYGAYPDKSHETYFHQLVSSLKLEQRVDFHGYKNRSEMTLALCRARFFVFSRPPSFQAHFGFSTKLGEYLATGKPVIVSQVGEVSRYLNDGVNALLCRSEPEEIAAKIIEIQENYDKALIIGQEGRNTSMLHFNNKVETKKIIDWLHTFAKVSKE